MECHVKQAVPNSKGREGHAKKSGLKDRKTVRPARAKWHGRATCAAVTWSDRAKLHDRATTVLLQDGFKTWDFVLVWG